MDMSEEAFTGTNVREKKEMPWPSWKTSLEAFAPNEVEKRRRKLKSGKRWITKLLLLMENQYCKRLRK